VIFYLEKGKMFIEVRCAELFLDLYNFNLKEILNATYPQHLLAGCPVKR
jgi:hypothetical protein